MAETSIVESDNQHKLRARQQELGKVGEWFGSRENAALYFAFFLVSFALIILSLIAYGEPSLRSDIAKVVGAIGIAGLGFIGGLLSK